MTATGSQTEAGTSENGYAINWGEVNPGDYIVTENLGILEVTPLIVAFDMDCRSSDFDGFPQLPGIINGISGSYADADTVEKVSQSNDKDSNGYGINVTAVFNLRGGGKVQLYSEGSTNAGSYTITPTVTMLAGAAENYSFSFTNNSGTIYPIEAEFSIGGGYDVYYDGQFHGGDLKVHCDNEMFFYEEKISDTQWKVSCFNGDVINVTITGGGTEVGSYTLACTYSFATGNSNNYNIDLWGEELRITTWDYAITLTAESADKVYDGAALTAPNVSMTEGFLNWDWNWSAVTSGSQINAGSSGNVITEYHIYNENGIDITGTCTNVTLLDGTLTVEPLSLSIDLGGGGSAVYSGEVVGEPGAFTVSYTNGPHAGETVASDGGAINPGSVTRTYTLYTNDSFSLRADMPTEVGTHALSSGANFSPAGNGSNYNISYSNNSFTVEKLKIEIELKDMEVGYHGYPQTPDFTIKYLNGPSEGENLTVEDYTMNDDYSMTVLCTLCGEDELTVTIPPSGAETGSYNLSPTYKISGTASNYNITAKGCTVTITPEPYTT